MVTIEELENILTHPSDRLLEDMRTLDGDILILGVGGKMGPSLAKLAKNCVDMLGMDKRVYAAARFSTPELAEELQSHGIHTLQVDLLDKDQLQRLPSVANVIFMAGTKFGTTGNEHLSWMMNTHMPGNVAEKYKDSRIVVFSTGNVYPLQPVLSGGALESTDPEPIGEYAQSCLGRERIFEHFSRKYGTPMTIFRLNYAIDMRYGVLVEIAKSVKQGKPIDLTMGHMNCIWQGDANEMALRSLTVCGSPPNIVNVSGPEMLSVRWVANVFAEKFGVEPVFENTEAMTALLSNCSKAHQLFGYPNVSVRQMMDWIAEWQLAGGESWNKPTHFQERKGKF